MARQFTVPKNYFSHEYPLVHHCNLQFKLGIDSDTSNSTIVPLFFNDTDLTTGPDNIEVNPENPSYTISTGQALYKDSIVPRLNFSMEIKLSKAAIETDLIRVLKVHWSPMYFAFQDMYNRIDEKTQDEVRDVWEMQMDDTDEIGYPIYNGTDLTILGATNSNNLGTEVKGLTTDAKIEGVAFDMAKYYDALQYYQNYNSVKMVNPGGMRVVYPTRDRTVFIHSNNFTYPTVKRMNKYTFCGILLHADVAGGRYQVPMGAADTTSIDHLDVNLRWRFEEWNTAFDQIIE